MNSVRALSSARAIAQAGEHRRRSGVSEAGPAGATLVLPPYGAPLVVVRRQGHGEALCTLSIEDAARLAIAFAAIPAELENTPIAELPRDEGHATERRALPVALRGPDWGDARFNAETGDLSAAGRRVRLPPVVAAVFGVLWAAGGRLVTREHLYETVWARRDSYETLDIKTIDVQLSKVRTALRAAGMPFEIRLSWGRGWELNRTGGEGGRA